MKKHEPVRHKNTTVYICPKSTNYRVKLDGEKNDKAFSWKRLGATEGWAQVGVQVRLTNLVEACPTMAESATQLAEATPTYCLGRGLVSQSTARKVQKVAC